MTVLPVVAREMGILARRKSMYWSRWVTSVLALVVMVWLLLVSASRLSFAQLGASIFLILSSLCFVFTLLVGMQATADCLSEEKREGTLGLLFLTDLKGLDVVGGKMAASSMQSVLVLIGVIPMLSLAILLGGVTLKQFGEVALVLGNTMFLSLSLGVFVSALSRNERKAMMGTFVGLFLIVLGPLIFRAIAFRTALGEEFVAISPLYAFGSAHSVPGTRPAMTLFGLWPTTTGNNYFWHSLAATHLLGWVFLGVSAWFLPRSINELPAQRFARLREFADRFVFGTLAQRKAHRASLLDRNAFLWLAARERAKPRYAWGILAFFGGLYLWIRLQFDDMLFDIAICTALMFLSHLVLKVWVASEVCSRLIQDRRSGALELLLSTPLSVRQIAEGQSLALRRVFLKPVVALILLEVGLLYGGLNAGFNSRDMDARTVVYAVGITIFLVDLWALKWVGLWLSLTGKSIERVLIATVARILVLPWVLFLVLGGLIATNAIFMGRGAGLDFRGGVIGWGAISLLVSLGFGAAARESFLTRFRELAARRFDVAAESEPERIEPKQRTASRRAAPRRHPFGSLVVASISALILILWGRSGYWSYRVGVEKENVRAEGYPVTLNEMGRYYPAPARDEDAFAMLEEKAGPMWIGTLRAPRRIGGRIPTEEEIRENERVQAQGILLSGNIYLPALWSLPRYKSAYIDVFGIDSNLSMKHYHHQSYSTLLYADLLVNGAGGLEDAPKHAENSIRALLAHARLLRRQPVMLGQLCANESLRRLMAALEGILEADVLDEQALQRVQLEAVTVDDPGVAARALALQRVMMLEPPVNRFGIMFGGAGGRPPGFAFWNSLRAAVGSQDKQVAEALSDYRWAIELTGRPPQERLEAVLAFDERRVEAGQRAIAAGTGNAYMTHGISSLFWSDAVFVANLHLIQAALALELHQQRYGKAPETLAALVPEFLSRVPIDPFAGGELRMIKGKEGWSIYSVGMDRADDTAGERPRRTGSDIVFTFR